ncbi:MAG TPA: T9SS type A sorting domain-containing protein, partial [Flavobacterium sp.]|nr:T9SS type A sorting domain-containing protein [Flavobacterium sp.]
WGANFHGQLGDGSSLNTTRTSPVRIGTASNWDTVSAGGESSAARKISWALWTWGLNESGQLGNGTTTDTNVPAQMGTMGEWQSFDIGIYHMVATDSNGLLWAWGRNDISQLGDGTTTNRTTPISIGTASNWQSVSADFEHSKGLRSDGSLWAWGYNSNGQLGDGTNIDRNQPTAISCAVLAVNDFGTANEMKVYPNPVKDMLNITFDKEITSVSIYNILGQEVVSKPLHANEGKIDVSNLKSGTYLVKVYANDQVKTLKIIKE